MPPPSYPHRHLLLTQLLGSLTTPCPNDAFAQPDEAKNERGCLLDALLLEGWTATGTRAQLLDKDVLQHAENLRLKKSDFEVLGRVGEGQFGVVDAVRSKLDGKVYAMKSIEKTMAMRAGTQLNLSIERHIHGLANTLSPAPAFAAAFQSPTSLHLVASFAPCGSLWDRLCEMLPVPGLDTGKMEEEEVGWWAKQMVRSVSWLHNLGYVHRDIKPHNFLLLPDGRLWLTDFGSAAPLKNGAVPRHLCLLPTGTPDYVAPEVLRIAEDAVIEAAHSDADETDGTIKPSGIDAAGYGPEVDWWSLGATLFEMSVGRAPFFAPSIGATYDRIMRCEVRMPAELSPQLKSLLSGLLSPPDVRLGSGDAAQIRKHSFFRGVDWSAISTPPTNLVCTPIDLDTLADTFDHSADDDVTFDHFFNSTVACTTMTSSPSVAPPPATWGRWVGWTLDPPADYFGAEPPPAIMLAPATLKPTGSLRQHSAPPATHLFTPRRPLRGISPPTAPRTAPRSVPRTRPVSERRAFAELVQCVQASARKKLASSTKIPGSATSTVSSAGGWAAEHPPTPTPVSRDMSSRASVRPEDRVREGGALFPPRALSRAMSLRDGASTGSANSSVALPSRAFSRTASLPAREARRPTPPIEVVVRPPSLQDVSENTSQRTQRTVSNTSNTSHSHSHSHSKSQSMSQRTQRTISSRRSDSPFKESPGSRSQSHSHSHSRTLSVTSARGSVPTRINTSSLREDTFLARLCATKEEDARTRSSHSLPMTPPDQVPEAQPRVHVQSQAHLEYVCVAHPYVAPRDPDPSRKGDRYASMKVWHASLEDGLDNLETRLAELMRQLEN